MIKVRKCIRDGTPYRAPWEGLDRIGYLRFDLNENTQPPPSHVGAAVKRLVDEGRLQMYPDYRGFMPKLAEYAGVSPQHLLVTNGSDQAIDILLRSFLGRRDSMLVAQPEFPMFSQIAQLIGARVVGVPFGEDLGFPESEFAARIGPDCKLAVFIDPNNPTGTSTPRSLIRKTLERWPETPVVVDEAYYEYTARTALPLLSRHSNLIILRTFSKAFAMAGLRLGYIIAAPPLIEQFSKVRGPFAVNSCALAAAEAQIEDPSGWRRHVAEVMRKSKPRLVEFLKALQIRFNPSAAHFMLVWPPDRDAAVEYLKDRGILVRPMSEPLIEGSFRMSLGTLDETKRFMAVFEAFAKKRAAGL